MTLRLKPAVARVSTVIKLKGINVRQDGELNPRDTPDDRRVIFNAPDLQGYEFLNQNSRQCGSVSRIGAKIEKSERLKKKKRE